MTPHPVDLEALQKLLDEWKAMGAHCPRSMTTDTRPGPAGIPVYDRLGIAAVNALPALLAEVRAARQASSVDDLRAQGWSVAVHNDYRLNGSPHTFWLLTMDGRAVKGEGRTDAEAMTAIRAALASPSVPPPQEKVQEAGAAPPAPPRVGVVYTHRKGGRYTVYGVATEATNGRPPERVVVYVGEDDRWWVRAEREFMDGRFTLASNAPAAGPLAPPVLEEKAQEPAATPEGRLAQWAAGHDPYGPAAQETAAPKEGGEAAAFVAKLPRAPDVDFEIDPPAVSQQPGVAPAPKRHKCMRCGKEFDCPHGASCQAKYDVLPRYFLPDGTLVDHCGPLPKQPTAGPPSAPALPKEEVAPDLPCVHGRRGLCPHCFLAPAPLPEEQLPKDGTCETHQGLHERTAACVRWWPHAQPSGSAAAPALHLDSFDARPASRLEEQPSKSAAPAPGDAEALWELLSTCVDEVHGPHVDCGPIDHIREYEARVRSEERERRDERADKVFEALFDVNQFLKSTAGDWAAPHTTLCFCDQGGECPAIAIRAEAKTLLRKAAVALDEYRRASDATSAGGGE